MVVKSITTPGLPDVDKRKPIIRVYDNVLDSSTQRDLLLFLRAPGWTYGAYSADAPNPPRYWYKHFAGLNRDSGEVLDPVVFERQLELVAPPVARMWRHLEAGPMSGHTLARCYANGYPFGSEGSVHYDSDVPSHWTAIYYPHLEWSPDYAGETVFFDSDRTDIIASAYPRPNRLVVFRGIIPHVARAITRACPELRITLMFKTLGPP